MIATLTSATISASPVHLAGLEESIVLCESIHLHEDVKTEVHFVLHYQTLRAE